MKSNIEAVDLPFYKLSDSQDLILFLIKKELQGTKFTRELDRLGFDTGVYCSDLGVVIMSLVGLTGRTDELWGWFIPMMDSYAEKVDLWDHGTTQELALDVYLELRTKLKSMQ
ncbi:MAG: hypothetical protein AAF616_14425 [Bacteroidota bacterium]